MGRKGLTLLELMIILVIVFVLATLVINIKGCSDNYSNGSRIGTVVKFSRKGTFNKSYEGELLMSNFSMSRANGSESNVWEFSATDKDIADQLETAMNEGQKVRLHYHQVGYTPVMTSTSYIVDGVFPVGKKAETDKTEVEK